jgi:hypothetical protein
MLAVAFVLFSPGRAEAQVFAYPTRYVQRPLTLGSGMLRFDGNAIFRHRAGPADETFGIEGGLGIGLTRDLELGALFLPLQLAPSVDYQRPSVYLMGRLARGTAEVGVRGSITIPTNDAEFVTLEAGLPVLIHFGQVARLDFGAFLQLETSNPLAWWVRFPLALSFNVTPRLALGPYAGFRIRLDDRGNEIPVGFMLSYTIGGGNGHPVGDVGGQFQFDDVTGSAGNWSMALITRWYLYL